MRRIWHIGLKDLLVTFRDRGALIPMLLAPFLLTLGMGFITGSFNRSGDRSFIEAVRVVVVNQDTGPLGGQLVEVLQSADLAQLLNTTTADDPEASRRLVENDDVAAAVLIPPGFSAGLIPDASGRPADPAPLTLYTNPAQPISAGVVQAVVEQFVDAVQAGVVGVQVTVAVLMQSGRLDPAEIAELAPQLAAQSADVRRNGPLTLETNLATGERFNPLAVLAPGMALFFLMYTVTLGGRSILQERQDGTLPRMMTTPTTATEVLGGKVLGIFLIAVAQVGILIAGSTVLFRLNWGDPIGVAALTAAAALAASGWGMLLAAVAKRPSQVANLGSAIMLLFGLLSGLFIDTGQGALNLLSRITPNAWALRGFIELGSGGTLGAITGNLAALGIMAALLFSVSVVLFRRRAVF